MSACPAERKTVTIKYYLLHLDALAANDEMNTVEGETGTTSQAYVKPRELIELDRVLCLQSMHGFARGNFNSLFSALYFNKL